MADFSSNVDPEQIKKAKRFNRLPAVLCPTCRTPNKASAKRCVKGDAWLLDEYWRAHSKQDNYQPKGNGRIGWFWGLSIVFIILMSFAGVAKNISSFLLLLFLISAAAFIVGLIHPVSIVKWATPSRSMVAKSVLPLAVMFFIAFVVTAGNVNKGPGIGTVNSQATMPSQAPPVSMPDLQIIETHGLNENYVRYAAGTVKNNSNKNYSSAEVAINLYDSSGAQVGRIVS